MTSGNIELHYTAVLIWLPPGQAPDVQTFDLSQASPPPNPNPELWWTVRDAISYAAELRYEDRHSKVPWIKWGHKLLSPKEIMETYNKMKTG